VGLGNDEPRLEQPIDQASSQDKLKIEEPDHWNRILRAVAPESSRGSRIV
jgi:hypothetical protein